jgi:hypothetical protein
MMKILTSALRIRGVWIILCALPVLLTSGEAQAGGREFWLSLLVPGWGQLQSGRTTSGSRFMTTEVALWGGYLGLKRLADSRQVNYETYAAEHASARPDGKDGEYFDDLAFYESRHQHNQFARVDDGPEAELYPDTASFFWEWDDEVSRERYRGLRNSAETADRNAVYITGLVVFNHVAAAIHAARSSSDVARDVDPQLELILGPADIDRFHVTLMKRF